MRLDPAGLPFIGGAVVLALLVGFTIGWPLSIVFFVAAAFFAFFFRDPERTTPTAAGQVLAPADGRVLVAGAAIAESAPPGVWQQVSIFLSPLDVHVNRVPVSGRVTRVTYTPGRFL